MSPTGSLLFALLGAAWAADPAPPAPADPAGPVEAPPEEDETDLRDAVPPPVRVGTPDAPPVPRIVLGATVGAAVPLAHLGPSVAPGLEGGYVLDAAGRYTVVLGVAYSGGAATGTAEDPAFAEPYTWRLNLRAMQVAPSFRVRLLPWTEKLSPEVAAGPLLVVGDAVTTGSAAGAAFPETREARVMPGGFVSGGIVGRVGPGTLEGRLTVSLVHLDGTLTGGALVPSITPAIGYRVAR